MSMTLEQILLEALDDEYMARATYNRVIREFGPVRPFSNIVQAENRHVHALLPLFEKYGIEVPKDTWDSRVETPASLLEAARAGVQAEIDNAGMYDRLLASSRDFPDVQQVLRNLQRASQNNHLPAFQRAAARYSGTATPAGQALEQDMQTPSDPACTQQGWGASGHGWGSDNGGGHHGHGHGGCGGGHGGGHGWGGGHGRW